jgi:hypothetical protein
LTDAVSASLRQKTGSSRGFGASSCAPSHNRLHSSHERWTAAGVERLASLLRESVVATGDRRLPLAAAALDASGRGRPEHDNSIVQDAIGTTYLIELVQRL